MGKSCILMHISSLPSAYGIGKMGKSAYDFVDFLSECGIKCWQILPLSPTSFGDSPYQSFSVFAGNPYFIDFDILKQEGLLKKSDYSGLDWQDNDREVNYSKIYNNCFKVLKQAYKSYRHELSAIYHKFVEENAYWLDDYALFMALKFKNDGKPWYEWDKKLAMREKKALEKAKSELAKDIEFFKFIQYKFFKQWFNLKKYANDKGIQIIGDIPIYVAYDSVEVWSQPELFMLDKNKTPTSVAGCPPDVFSELGQLWGNPLYDWKKHKETDFEWWTKRTAFATRIYDIVRIDHFRGFESFYTIPYGNENAIEGEWLKGPDYELFETLEKKLGKLNIIAEDLGFLTPEVYKMLGKTGFPGMKILEFGFDGDSSSEYLPHNFKTSNCIVYTGTHDNDTAKGWANSLNKKSLAFCKDYLRVVKRKDIPWALIRLAWSSCAETAVAQMQDFLEIGSEGRMNVPSTLGTNWLWRAKESDFSPKLIKKITALNKLYNR